MTFATTYDALLRPAVVSSTGSLATQNQITTYGFDWLGHLKNVEQHYTNGGGFTSGTSTLVQRTYDGYGHITSEKIFIDGTSTAINQFNQTWDAAGNRASLASQLTPQGSGAGRSTSYGYWADGLLKQETVVGGSSYNFAYGTNGQLTSRTNPWRTQTITGRDLLGRITAENTSVSGSTPLGETQSWTGRATRSNYTAIRSGTNVWNESRNYGYNGRGQMFLESDAPAVNTYADTLYCFDFDLGIPTTGNGLGVRTLAMRRNSASDYSNWQIGSYATDNPALFNWVTQKGVDAFQRPISEEKALTQNLFYSHSATYDSAGNTTWRSYWTPDASQNPQQTLTWDAQGRLVKVAQRDWSNSGYDWRAIYDGLGRRLRTVQQNISGGTNSGATLRSASGQSMKPAEAFQKMKRKPLSGIKRPPFKETPPVNTNSET